MRAAVFKGAGVLALEDVPEPVIDADDDVIIEVEACGICGSDLQILNVPPGHPADPCAMHQRLSDVFQSGIDHSHILQV